MYKKNAFLNNRHVELLVLWYCVLKITNILDDQFKVNVKKLKDFEIKENEDNNMLYVMIYRE